MATVSLTTSSTSSGLTGPLSSTLELVAKPDPKVYGTSVAGTAARTLGIDPKLPLAEMCASFYLLEQLEQELFPYYEDVRIDRRLYPLDYGKGTRTERRGYQVRSHIDKIETLVADQFIKYIFAACGGEARYANSAITERMLLVETGETNKSGRAVLKKYNKNGKPKPTDWPGPFTKKLLAEFPSTGGTNGRYTAWMWWADSIHASRKRPHTQRRAMVAALDEMAALFEMPIWQSEGNYLHYTAPDGRRVGVMGARVHHVDGKLTAKYPDNLMGTSVGGLVWALPAKIAASYLRGEMSRRTFIDRCWSLQHNGGSLFNKVFGGLSKLTRVLILQEQGDYETLLPYTSEYVLSLWCEHRREKDWLYTPPHTKRRKGPTADHAEWVRRIEAWQEEMGHSAGCPYCYQEWANDGTQDPCNGMASGCAYKSKYEDEIGDWSGVSPWGYENCSHCCHEKDEDGDTICAHCGSYEVD